MRAEEPMYRWSVQSKDRWKLKVSKYEAGSQKAHDAFFYLANALRKEYGTLPPVTPDRRLPDGKDKWAYLIDNALQYVEMEAESFHLEYLHKKFEGMSIATIRRTCDEKLFELEDGRLSWAKYICSALEKVRVQVERRIEAAKREAEDLQAIAITEKLGSTSNVGKAKEPTKAKRTQMTVRQSTYFVLLSLFRGLDVPDGLTKATVAGLISKLTGHNLDNVKDVVEKPRSDVHLAAADLGKVARLFGQMGRGDLKEHAYAEREELDVDHL